METGVKKIHVFWTAWAGGQLTYSVATISLLVERICRNKHRNNQIIVSKKGKTREKCWAKHARCCTYPKPRDMNSYEWSKGPAYMKFTRIVPRCFTCLFTHALQTIQKRGTSQQVGPHAFRSNSSFCQLNSPFSIRTSKPCTEHRLSKKGPAKRTKSNAVCIGCNAVARHLSRNAVRLVIVCAEARSTIVIQI